MTIPNAIVVDRIWADDKCAEVMGERIANILELEPDPVFFGMTKIGMYHTGDGPKTPAGLARLVLEMMDIQPS